MEALLAIDVSRVDPDAVIIDALARLQVAAQRQGCRVRLRNASRELVELITFMGLREALALEPGRQSEERE